MAVHDIKNFNSFNISSISSEDVFVLDANVLLFLHFAKSLDRDKTKAFYYSNFVRALIQNGNTVGTSVAYLQEVLNVIEKIEYGLYKARCQQETTAPVSRKQFRKIPAERAAVEKEAKTVYQLISQSYKIYDNIDFSIPVLNGFINDFQNHSYDPMDYIAVSDLVNKSCLNIITDDSDYRTDPRIQVYTFL